MPTQDDVLAHMLRNAEKRTAAGLAGAIKTMRDACDQAERHATEADRIAAISQVVHALVWGLANAQTRIADAMSAQADAAALQLAAKESE